MSTSTSNRLSALCRRGAILGSVAAFWASSTLPSQAGGAGVVSTSAMVVTADSIASTIGNEVLLDGGNAVDAAVAVGFALAVTLPRAGNIARRLRF